MRNSSLWSNVVFEKGVISQSNIKILHAWSYFLDNSKHTNFWNNGVFSFIILLQLWWLIESKLSQFFCLHMLGYTKWEYWSLTITNAFKEQWSVERALPVVLLCTSPKLDRLFAHSDDPDIDEPFQAPEGNKLGGNETDQGKERDEDLGLILHVGKCPLVIALVPLKCPSRNLQLPHRVPVYQEENALVPLPF